MTTWQFEKQFVNKLSLLRIILQRKGKNWCLVSLFAHSRRLKEHAASSRTVQEAHAGSVLIKNGLTANVRKMWKVL